MGLAFGTGCDHQTEIDPFSDHSFLSFYSSFFFTAPVPGISIANTQSLLTCISLFMAYPQHTLAGPGPRQPLSTFTTNSTGHSQNLPLTSLEHASKSPKDRVPANEPNPPYTFICTVCWREHDPPHHTFGLESRIVCVDC